MGETVRRTVSSVARTLSSRVAAATGQAPQETAVAPPSPSQSYFQPSLLNGLPVGPFFSRATVRTELVPGSIWGFEQPQTLANVTVNIRMTVVRLASGGLFVYAPVAPSRECLRLLAELGGDVEIIVLPTFAVEHKVGRWGGGGRGRLCGGTAY